MVDTREKKPKPCIWIGNVDWNEITFLTYFHIYLEYIQLYRLHLDI